jgi:hypothetical protein
VLSSNFTGWIISGELVVFAGSVVFPSVVVDEGSSPLHDDKASAIEKAAIRAVPARSALNFFVLFLLFTRRAFFIFIFYL